MMKEALCVGKWIPHFPEKNYKDEFHLFMRGNKMNNEAFHKLHVMTEL